MTIETPRHALNRTSPKGQPFIGTCVRCGRTGLTAKRANEECDNPSQMTADEALLAVLVPPPQHREN